MRSFVLLFALSSTRLLAAEAPFDTNSVLNFELRDPKTKEVYFSGQEKVSQEGKSVRRDTLYFDGNKKEVQKETFTFDTDSLRALNFNSENELTGEESRLTSKDQGFELGYRSSKEDKGRSNVITSDKEVFHPKVAGDLIRRNWEALMAGKSIKFELAVPSRLETIPFQLVHRESKEVDNEAREVFTLMPQNILIRMLAPHLEFQFSKDKTFKQAIFPSGLPIKGVKDKVVEMVFKS